MFELGPLFSGWHILRRLSINKKIQYLQQMASEGGTASIKKRKESRGPALYGPR
jgi:hypothetical protein